MNPPADESTREYHTDADRAEQAARQALAHAEEYGAHAEEYGALTMADTATYLVGLAQAKATLALAMRVGYELRQARRAGAP